MSSQSDFYEANLTRVRSSYTVTRNVPANTSKPPNTNDGVIFSLTITVDSKTPNMGNR